MSDLEARLHARIAELEQHAEAVERQAVEEISRTKTVIAELQALIAPEQPQDEQPQD
jgi:hypothetical protein